MTIVFPTGLAGEPTPLQFAPPADVPVTADERRARLLQRIRLRLSTPRGSVPLDRTFGIDPDVLDAPATHVAALRAAVAEAVRPEPGARLLRVEVDRGAVSAGRLPVRVVVEVD